VVVLLQIFSKFWQFEYWSIFDEVIRHTKCATFWPDPVCVYRPTKFTCLCVLRTSENSERRQRFLRSWRYAVVRQVQVVEALHEGVRSDANLSVGRLQPVAAQMLPAHQSDCMQLGQVTSSVRSLQQSAVQ